MSCRSQMLRRMRFCSTGRALATTRARATCIKAAQIVRDEHGGIFPDTLEAVTGVAGHRALYGGRDPVARIRPAPRDPGWQREASACPPCGGRRLAGHHVSREAAVGDCRAEHADEKTAAYTQAIMDLGATLCTRCKPACERCPVASDCVALETGTVTLFAGAQAEKAKPLRATTMVIARHDGHVYLERRPEAGIWGGLWSLPEVDGVAVEAWCAERLCTDGGGNRCLGDVAAQLQPLRSRYSADSGARCVAIE